MEQQRRVSLLVSASLLDDCRQRDVRCCRALLVKSLNEMLKGIKDKEDHILAPVSCGVCAICNNQTEPEAAAPASREPKHSEESTRRSTGTNSHGSHPAPQPHMPGDGYCKLEEQHAAPNPMTFYSPSNPWGMYPPMMSPMQCMMPYPPYSMLPPGMNMPPQSPYGWGMPAVCMHRMPMPGPLTIPSNISFDFHGSKFDFAGFEPASHPPMGPSHTMQCCPAPPQHPYGFHGDQTHQAASARFQSDLPPHQRHQDKDVDASPRKTEVTSALRPQRSQRCSHMRSKFNSTGNLKRRVHTLLFWKSKLGVDFPVVDAMLRDSVWRNLESCEYGIKTSNGHPKFRRTGACINPYHYFARSFKALLTVLDEGLHMLGVVPANEEIAALLKAREEPVSDGRSKEDADEEVFNKLCTLLSACDWLSSNGVSTSEEKAVYSDHDSCAEAAISPIDGASAVCQEAV